MSTTFWENKPTFLWVLGAAIFSLSLFILLVRWPSHRVHCQRADGRATCIHAVQVGTFRLWEEPLTNINWVWLMPVRSDGSPRHKVMLMFRAQQPTRPLTAWATSATGLETAVGELQAVFASQKTEATLIQQDNWHDLWPWLFSLGLGLLGICAPCVSLHQQGGALLWRWRRWGWTRTQKLRIADVVAVERDYLLPRQTLPCVALTFADGQVLVLQHPWYAYKALDTAVRQQLVGALETAVAQNAIPTQKSPASLGKMRGG